MKAMLKGLLLPFCLCLALPAQAHRGWLLPSATVLSDTGAWVTVDAAMSNDLFFFEHFPIRLEGVGTSAQGVRASGRRAMPPRPLTILAPDGTKLEPQNGAMGRYRSTFDVQLEKQGTYKIAVVSAGLSASYTLNGERKRWLGDNERFAKEIPADAKNLNVTERQWRLETFVTVGSPTKEVFKPMGKGLELDPVTHPNDLFAGEAAKFRFLLDGKPAPGVKASVILGGIRYRDQLKEMTVTSDADGVLSITWPEAGMYWIEAVIDDDHAEIENAKRRAAYTATFEVLKP